MRQTRQRETTTSLTLAARFTGAWSIFLAASVRTGKLKIFVPQHSETPKHAGLLICHSIFSLTLLVSIKGCLHISQRKRALERFQMSLKNTVLVKIQFMYPVEIKIINLCCDPYILQTNHYVSPQVWF